MRWLVLATASVLAFEAAATDGPTPERRVELEYFLAQDCGSCHGLTLKGGLGPALTPQALAGKPVEFLQWTILHGRPGTAMPPWRTFLSDSEGLWLAERLLAGEGLR
jgi:cytochrome c55X